MIRRHNKVKNAVLSSTCSENVKLSERRKNFVIKQNDSNKEHENDNDASDAEKR